MVQPKPVDLRLIDARGRALSSAQVNQLVPRASVDIQQAISQIEPLLAEVKASGESAIVDVTIARDGVDPRPLKVTKEELARAVAELSPSLRRAIEEAIERVFKVSRANLPQDTTVKLAEGALVHQRWQPVDSVGLYVPGGKAVYPSSVIMNVVPAQVAGVQRLALASPAQKDFNGRPHPTVLATAALLGVEDVYCMGGPAAIAAFAYGIPQISFAPVSLVTGPGNIYVAAAKRALRGLIGIDSEAGTTEILVIADESANARLIAYDLVSQAEHDEAAASVLVTDSEPLAHAVINELADIVDATSHSERVRTALEGQQSAIVLVDSLQSAIDFSNHYATEHLEIHTSDNKSVLSRITNAGAIFLGDYSPVSLGDYMAGSSHVLPTGQQAKFGSGLGVHSFLRPQQVIDYNQQGLAQISSMVADFAEAEGLPAHGEAVTARFNL
ncbi:histidinol dehydrogenase [Rhodoluna sp.]|uniref:histidinol dehydrogenase n=1 Tax=Rhodoluna sp. TaxID=1969481 RepID=UPI0025E77212|nr:histidinol dehydrogenase [Rhodoluna sp.]